MITVSDYSKLKWKCPEGSQFSSLKGEPALWNDFQGRAAAIMWHFHQHPSEDWQIYKLEKTQETENVFASSSWLFPSIASGSYVLLHGVFKSRKGFMQSNLEFLNAFIHNIKIVLSCTLRRLMKISCLRTLTFQQSFHTSDYVGLMQTRYAILQAKSNLSLRKQREEKWFELASISD